MNHIKLALRNYLSDLRTWELFAAVAFVLVVLACCGCAPTKGDERLTLVSVQYLDCGYMNIVRDKQTGREFLVTSGGKAIIEIKPREEQ